MNIFALSYDPERCAQAHCDKHVVKMILEHAQMMATVVRESGIEHDGYRSTHKHHPCTLWLGQSSGNWDWLMEMTYQLDREYRFRYDHDVSHKSWSAILALPEPDLPHLGLTPFAQAMPDEFKHEDGVVAYRRYYSGAKSPILSYTKREQPEWI